jgi:hypothetical protein
MQNDTKPISSISGLKLGALASVSKQLHRMLLVLPIFFLFLAMVPTAASAQLNPGAANCAELSDPDTKFQMDLCSAHAGCLLVMSAHDTCEKAKKFLSNLKLAMSRDNSVATESPATDTSIFGKLKNISGRNKKEVASNHVFEASLSDRQRAFESDENWKEIINLIRNATLKTKNSINATNPNWVSTGNFDKYGSVVDGFEFKVLGNAKNSILIKRVMDRDISRNGGASQDAIVVNSDERVVTTFLRDGKSMIYFYKHGVQYRGEMQMRDGRDEKHGHGVYITEDGHEHIGTYVNDKLTEGVIRRPDGSLLAKGTWNAAGDLAKGQIFDGTGINVTETVDPIGDQKRAAAAKEAKAASDFRINIANMNAGQLFAGADEFSAKGDNAKAREVLRTLVSRFPDHPLAAAAAQQMATMSAASAGSANAAANNNSNTGAPASSGGSAGGSKAGLQLSCNDSLEPYLSSLPNFSASVLRGVVSSLRSESAKHLSSAKAGRLNLSQISGYQQQLQEYKNSGRQALENHRSLTAGPLNAAVCNPADGSQASAWAATQIGVAFNTWVINVIRCTAGQTALEPLPAFCPY